MLAAIKDAQVMCFRPHREEHGVTDTGGSFVKEEAVALNFKREGLHWNKRVAGRIHTQ